MEESSSTTASGGIWGRASRISACRLSRGSTRPGKIMAPDRLTATSRHRRNFRRPAIRRRDAAAARTPASRLHSVGRGDHRAALAQSFWRHRGGTFRCAFARRLRKPIRHGGSYANKKIPVPPRRSAELATSPCCQPIDQTVSVFRVSPAANLRAPLEKGCSDRSFYRSRWAMLHRSSLRSTAINGKKSALRRDSPPFSPGLGVRVPELFPQTKTKV